MIADAGILDVESATVEDVVANAVVEDAVPRDDDAARDRNGAVPSDDVGVGVMRSTGDGDEVAPAN